MMIMKNVTLMVHNKLLNFKSYLCHDIVINLVSSYHFVNNCLFNNWMCKNVF